MLEVFPPSFENPATLHLFFPHVFYQDTVRRDKPLSKTLKSKTLQKARYIFSLSSKDHKLYQTLQRDLKSEFFLSCLFPGT